MGKARLSKAERKRAKNKPSNTELESGLVDDSGDETGLEQSAASRNISPETSDGWCEVKSKRGKTRELKKNSRNFRVSREMGKKIGVYNPISDEF